MDKQLITVYGDAPEENKETAEPSKRRRKEFMTD
jgi:hypothetical protein